MALEKITETYWEAPEFIYREKGILWYWLSVFFAVALVGAAIWQKNLLFAFFIAVAEILFLIWSSKKPETIGFRLNGHGLHIGENKFYGSEEINFFSLSDYEDADWQTMILYLRGKILPTIKINVPSHKTEEIKNIFKTFSGEKEHQLSLIDALEEFLRF